MREVGQFMQPGYLQLQRDDALLLFVQRGALMICTGSWDSTSIEKQAPFEIAVGPVPFPDEDDPRYGEFTEGALSEAGTNAGLALGIVRTSPNPEVALDFLLFLASQPMNQIWTELSGWVPSVVGVDAPDRVVPFLPQQGGFPAGLGINITPGGLADVKRLTETNLYRLVSPQGSIDDFVGAVGPTFQDAVVSSLRRGMPARLDRLRRADTQLVAAVWLARGEPGDSLGAKRLDRLLQATGVNERDYYLNQLVLDRVDALEGAR